MRYNENIQLKLYEYNGTQFVLQAIIDDYQEVSFEHNLYEAGTFTITINYNIPNATKFRKGLFIQFGDSPYDFGEIQRVQDSLGSNGKGSQTRTITGYDSRYILKRRVIKNLNDGDGWAMTSKGEICMRSLIADQCGVNAETKRQLPIANTIPAYADAIGKEYSVKEQGSNLYEVCKTIATQSEIGWRLNFNGQNLTLECYEGEDRSQLVQFSPTFDSLANGEFIDTNESFSNAVYISGKGQNSEKDLYEGEDGTPNGLDRFESWADESQMTNDSEYEAKALSMLTQYGQTLQMSGNGLAKCPYIYKEQYEVGDWITVGFNDKKVVVQILSVTERWAWNKYDINFSFGKPKNNLADQLQLMLRKIQLASNKGSVIDSVRWYTIPTDIAMRKEDLTFNTLGFTGNIGNSDRTFTLYFDNNSKAGSKSYTLYAKNLTGSGKLILTTGISGASNFTIKGGINVVARILVDEDGNVINQGMTATSVVESGNNQPVTSNAVYDKFTSITAVDAITNGDMHPVTSNAVYDYPIDSITDGQHRPPTSNAVYDALIKSTLITPIANSTYLTIIASNIQKTGNIVTVSVFGSLKAGTNKGDAIINGLPISTKGNNTNGIELSLFIGSGIRPAYLNGAGSLVAWYTISANTEVRINFTYTAKAL